MKTLLAILLLSLAASATITDSQHPAGVTNSSSTTCTVTVTATGTGANILLIYKIAADAAKTLASVSGGGTWTLCGANCNATNATAGSTNMAYLIGPTASVTSITGTLNSSSSTLACWAEKYTTDQTTFTVETTSSSNNKVDTSCTTACASASITITGANDVVTSVASCGATCSGTITGFNALYAGGDGSARQINITSSSFNWNQSPSSSLSTASLAFFDVAGSGGGTVRHRAQVIQSRLLYPRIGIELRDMMPFDIGETFIASGFKDLLHPWRSSAVRADHDSSFGHGQTFNRTQPAIQSKSPREAKIVAFEADRTARPNQIVVSLRQTSQRKQMVRLPSLSEKFQPIVSKEPRLFFHEGAFLGPKFVPHVERVPVSRPNVQTLHSVEMLDSELRQEADHFPALGLGVAAVKEKFLRLVDFD